MKKNLSYTYLLPLLSEHIHLPKLLLKYIINTYIKTNKNDDFGKFYILCKFEYSSTNFEKLEKLLIDNELYITSYDINDSILYEFNFPNIYINDQIKFINGDYSKLTEDSKKLILKFWLELYGHIPSFIKNALIKIKFILYKNIKLRKELEMKLNEKISEDAELGNKINEEEETYFFKKENEKLNLNNIKNVF